MDDSKRFYGIIAALIVGVLTAFSFNNLTSNPSSASLLSDPLINNAEFISETGTHFKAAGSDVTVDVNSELTMHIETNDGQIQLFIYPSPGTKTFTVSGLRPSKTYYKYINDLHNLETLIINETGSVIFSTNTSNGALISFLNQPSTVFIADDASGGDCTSVGSWDDPSNTCTLTTDVNATIQLSSDNLTLDCNGKTINPGGGNGVFSIFTSGNTIKNCNIEGAFFGVLLVFGTGGNTLEGNTSSGNNTGLLLFNSGTGNTITNNTFENNARWGLRIISGFDNTITFNNFIDNGFQSLQTIGFNNNYTIEDNFFSGNGITFSASRRDGLPQLLVRSAIALFGSNTNHTLSRNEMNGNAAGLSVRGINTTLTIDTTNTVNGKKIYYLKNEAGITINPTAYPDAAAIYCVGCSNVVIENFVLDSDNAEGIALADTTLSTVRNNVILNGEFGIYLENLAADSKNLITGNTITNGSEGIFSNPIFATRISNTTISGNIIDANEGQSGIYLSSGGNNNNEVSGNTIINALLAGIVIDGGFGNSIDFNTITNSTAGIHVETVTFITPPETWQQITLSATILSMMGSL